MPENQQHPWHWSVFGSVHTSALVITDEQNILLFIPGKVVSIQNDL